MEIKRFKKIKNNIYELYLDNDLTIKLYDDVIVKYNLLTYKVIDNNKLNEITKYNDSLDAYYLSIKYINKRLRCEKEIIKYLEKNNFTKEIIENTIKRLSKDGYLNKDLYVKSYINDVYNLKMDGPNKIKSELLKLNFDEKIINKYLNEKDFTLKIQKIIDKKTKSNHKSSNAILKQQISIYLTNLGYPKELFYEYLENIKVDNSIIIKNETNKLINKYKNKYELDELKYIIKNKLYQKGYNSEEIGDVISELL